MYKCSTKNDKVISNSIPFPENSQIETKDDPLLSPVNNVADIDIYCLNESLEVNII